MADPKAPAAPPAPAPPPSSRVARQRPMLVVSTAEGVYNGLRVRNAGFKFYLDEPEQFSWEWMEIVSASPEQRSRIRPDTRTLVKKRARAKAPLLRPDGRPVRAGGPLPSANPAALDEEQVAQE